MTVAGGVVSFLPNRFEVTLKQRYELALYDLTHLYKRSFNVIQQHVYTG